MLCAVALNLSLARQVILTAVDVLGHDVTCVFMHAGMTKLMDNDEVMGPINIGNPTEFTMLELAKVQPTSSRHHQL
jgi:hypothetical protein